MAFILRQVSSVRLMSIRHESVHTRVFLTPFYKFELNVVVTEFNSLIIHFYI